MSFKIIEVRQVCDGWDIDTDYRPEPFHFVVKPTDQQEAVDTAIAHLESLPDEIEDEIEVDVELDMEWVAGLVDMEIE